MRGTEYLIYFFFCSYFPYFSFLSPFIFVFIFIFLHFFLFRFYYFFYIIKIFFRVCVCVCLWFSFLLRLQILSILQDLTCGYGRLFHSASFLGRNRMGKSKILLIIFNCGG